MKIAQVCQYFYPEATGVTTHVHNLSKHLVSCGHEVDIYTPQREGTSAEEVLDGVRVHRIPTTLLYPRLFAHLKNGRFDIIHSHSVWQHTPVSLMAASITGAKFVLTTHGTWLHVSRDNLRVKLYRKTAWPYTVSHSSAIIIVNEDERPMLIDAGARDDKVLCIPNAVDTDIFRPTSSERGKDILFVGRIQKEKGVFTLIEAIPAVVKQFPDVRFSLVGRGDALEEAHALAARLGVTSNIVFEGYVENSELPERYSRAFAFVLPSEYENCAGVYLEAMACETPVIGTNVGGTRHMIVDGSEGYLIEPGDSNRLSDRLLELLSNNALARDMGRRGRARVQEHYSWASVTSRIETLYKSL